MAKLLRNTIKPRDTWLNVEVFKDKEKVEYKEYNQKYVIVLSYFFAALASSLYPYTFAPILPDIMRIYDASSQFMTL